MNAEQRILQAVIGLFTAIGKKADEEHLTAFAAALDLSPEAAEQACRRCAREWSAVGYPRPKDVRDLAPRRSSFICDDCHWCEGTGLVTVWEPLILLLIQMAEIPLVEEFEWESVNCRETRHPKLRQLNISKSEVAMACCCQVGERFRKQTFPPSSPHAGQKYHDDFDPTKHCPYRGFDHLDAWFEQREARIHTSG